MFGLRTGVTVAVLNSLILELNPGPLPTGPVYNLFAVISMLLGVILGYKLSSRLRFGTVALVTSATGFGILSRVIVMTLVNAAVLPLPYPFGFSIPYSGLSSFLYPIAIFNSTVTLYTVPLAYSVFRGVLSRYHAFSSERETSGMVGRDP